MILNVSGRTDIVAFYTEWFMKRLEAGFVDVRNPFNKHLVSRIFFSDVDAILFCTKNPTPIVKYLPKIDKPIIFHVTLTPYKKNIEPNVPDKSEIIESIKKISKIIGADNIYIRYDPILLNDEYNLEYHEKAFARVTSLLEGYVKHIIVSFIDDYKNVRKNMGVLKYREFTKDDYKFIGEKFSNIANSHNMTVQTCFEDETLVEYGFIKGECMSSEMAYALTGKKYPRWKARKEGKCECVQMVDIGDYNCCKHFCKYCYANYDEKRVQDNFFHHDDNSSLLIGHIEETDIIKRRQK